MAQLRSCGVFVMRQNPRLEFLLMKHPDRWDLPKGHVDPGESDIECALRELQEETGIPADAVDLDPDFQFTHEYRVQSKRTGGDWWPKTLVVFLAELTRNVPIVTTEHESYQWFPWPPPHSIQERTIDPLLEAVAAHLSDR